MTNSIFKTSHLNKLSRLRALARACAISSILVISTLAAQATANYVYHEQTANDLTAGAPNTCGGAQAYVPTLTPNSSQAYLLRFKIEYQFYTDTLKVYYTTDGSSPSGALGVPSGTTVVVNGSYQCTFTFAGNTIDVGNATIPAQPAGTVVKYIISARHSGGGPEIFANSGEFSSPFTTSAQATVFQYTVSSTPEPVVVVESRTTLANSNNINLGVMSNPPYLDGGAGANWANSAGKSSVSAGLVGFGSRFATAGTPFFTVTPTLTVGVTYAVQTTIQAASASANIVVALATAGTSASTLPATTTAFQTANGNLWITLGTITASSATPTVGFTFSSGTLSRFYSDAVRFVPVAAAGTKTWNGGGANDFWTTGLNWGGTAPNPAGGDAIAFAGSTRLTPAMDGPFTVNSLTFNPGAGVFAISGSGGGLTLATASGVVNNSTNAEVINPGINQGGTKLFMDTSAGTLTFGGIITGSGGYTKNGIGTVIWNNAGSTITGPVTINNGVFEITTQSRIGGTGVGAGDVTINGGTFRNDDTGAGNTLLTANRSIIMGASGGTVNMPTGTIQAYSGVISGAGNTFTLNGPGELRITTNATILAGAHNTFGKLVVDAAMFTLGTASASAYEDSLGAVPSVVTDDAITLKNGGRLRGNVSPITLDSKRGITIGPGGGFIRAVNSASTLTIPSAIKGSNPLTINTTDTGTVLISNPANSFGDVSINTGSLALGAAGVVPDTSLVTLSSGATFNLNGFSETVRSIAGAGGTVSLGSNTLTVASPAGESYASVISSTAAGKFVKNGTGVLSLSGGSSGFLGEFVLNDGTIGVGGSQALGAGAGGSIVTINGGKLSNTGTGGRTIPATVSANLNADFTVDDSLFTPNPGQILFTGLSTIRNGNRTITVSGAANLGFGGAVGQDAPGRSLVKAGSGILALTALNTYSGDTTINAGQININGTSTLGDATGTLHLSGGTLNSTATRTASSAPVANPVDVTADSSITTSSTAATVDLNLSNSAIGGSAGSLAFSNSAASGTGVFQPRFSGSGFTFTRPIIIANGAFGTTTLNSYNTTGTDQTFSGMISGTGGYTRNASTAGTGGRTILTGANMYSGGTTVNRGTLVVNNTTGSGTGSGAVTVNADGTLAGSGSISGPLVINGAIAPGTSPGTIFTGNESWNGGGSYIWEINLAGGTEGADPGWDLIDAGPAGSLTISATPSSRFTIKITSLSLADTAGPVSDFNNANEYFWRILKAGAGITGFDPAAFTLDTSAFANSLAGAFFIETADGGTSLRLHYIPAPLITQQPVPASAECGLSNAVFSVTATGPGPLSYQWRRNGSDLGGATGSTLAFSPATAADAGNYSVVVCNPGGCVTSTVVALTVPDTTPPFVNCGQHETVSCMQGWGFTVPIVIDNCDVGLVPVALSTVTNFGCGYTFEATRIWQVTDSSANVTYCTQLVSYVDFIPPTITACPPNVTVGCLTAVPPPDVSLVTATNMFDPCETVAPVVTHFGDVTNGVGPVIITRTYRASDACGNYSQCIQTITVQPAPPVITCGTNKTVECASAWSFDEPTASSPCCGTNVTITILDTVTNGVCPQEITRTWQATDCLTNSASCSQIVTVVDTTPPTLTCVTNKTVECGSCASGTNDFAAAVLKDFANTVADGWFPDGPLVRGPDGAWYGTALAGGNNNFGVIFKLNSDGGGYTALHYFNFTDGRAPFAGLHLASDGAFYGTTYLGGSSGKGVVFKMNPDGSGFTVLHQFSGGSDGSAPYAGVIEANNGVLYGVTAAEGANGPDAGTLFRINKDGSGYAILHQFGLSGDGYNPVTDLLQASDGALYGVTTGGGSDDFGVLFKIALDGSGYTLVHQFSLAGPDAHNPQGVLVEGGDGALYGTASAGGTPGNGAVFKVNKDGSGHILLHQFSGTDGSLPSAGLLIGQDGALYGAAYDGGDHSAGTAFRLNQDGSGFRVISHLGGPGAPANPAASLAQGADGALYGTSVAGGPSGFGTVFRLACTWAFDPPTVLDDCGGTNVTITVLDTVTNGVCPQLITRTWLATDACSNSASCGQTITVADTTPPVITCATNKTVGCADAWTFDPPTASDTCCTNITILTLDTVTNGAPCTEIITRTWAALDCCSNIATCTQTVTVTNAFAPLVLNCATNFTVECGTAWSFTPPTATGGCCTNIVISIIDTVTNGVCPQVITRTWQAVDCCSNTATCSQTVTVVDTTPPLVNCGQNETLQCGSSWDFTVPIVSDACSAVTLQIFSTTTNALCGATFQATRVWLASDLCNNITTCTQIVTIIDVTPPVLTCATNKTVDCASAWIFDPPSAFDACGGTNVTIAVVGTVTNGSGCSQDITRTWQATDGCGNPSTCSQTVTLQDTAPPVVTCATNKTVECASAWTFDPPTATDNCCTNVAISILGTVTNGAACAEIITRTWLAADCCSNTATCSQTVTVVDTTPPVITCLTNRTVECGACFAGPGLPNYTILRSFATGTDAQDPYASLAEGNDGALYGVTYSGGASGAGTIYKLEKDGSSYVVLHDFAASGAEGKNPVAALRRASVDGKFYGVTYQGGGGGGGTLFRVEPDGSGFTVLHDFASGDGLHPYGNLTVDVDSGILYGTALDGGANGFGTVFMVNRDGSGFTVLHSFAAAGDGRNPYGGVVQGVDGAFYGNTSGGGAAGLGTIYKLNPDGSGYAILHEFATTAGDGASPRSTLIQGSDLHLYGTTYGGGAAGFGTLYKMDTSGGGYAVIHNFPGVAGEGMNPVSRVVEGNDGALYGTTLAGGVAGSGTAYRIRTDGTDYSELHQFASYPGDGVQPHAGLVLATDGALYGTTRQGGIDGLGTVYRLACESAIIFDQPAALDACCGANVTITVLSTVTNGLCPKLITRTWQATDCCSNSATCSQTLTIADTTPPVLTCATNKTVLCGTAWTFDPPAAYDLCCGTNVSIAILDTVTNSSPSNSCSQVITRTWSATDCCSNTALCSQTVIINGPACVPPVITGVSLSGNTFYLSFQSLFGHSYAIEYKDGFSDPNWHLLQTVPGTGGVVTVQDTPASLEIRIYRVVCLGP